MVGYTLCGLLCWLPCCTDQGNSISLLFSTYLFLLCSLAIPATVLFAGVLFGALRGAIVSLFYTGSVILLLILLYLLNGDGSLVALIVGSWTWPLASLVIGWIYQRHLLLQGFGRAYVTMLAGMSIIGLGYAFLSVIAILVTSIGDPTTDVIGALLFLLFLIPFFTLPMALLEVIVQWRFEALQKMYRRLLQRMAARESLAVFFARRKRH